MKPACLLIVGLSILAAAGCFARRARPPPLPVAVTRPASLEGVNLYLRTFEIHGLGRKDSLQDIEGLQDSLFDYVEAETTLGSAQFNLSGLRQPEAPALDLRVDLKLEQETQRTWVLDCINVLFFGGFPLVPWWGDVFLTLQARISAPEGNDVSAYTYKIQSPFSAMAYAWYRRGYVERAYRRAFQEAFRRLAADIARDAPTLALVARRGPVNPSGLQPPRLADPEPWPIGSEPTDPASSPGDSGPMPTDAEPLPTDAETQPSDSDAEIPAALDAREAELRLAPDEEKVIFLAPVGFHLIRSDEEPEPEAGLWGTLQLLGGVEASAFGGLAHVSSKADDQDGEVIEVASGDAEQSGFRISLYTAPTTTGFFWYPTVGYMQQGIGNIDVASSLDDLNRSNDPNDIGAIASDPATGEAVDPGAANVYKLDMRCGYAGGRVGLDLVAGNESIVFFASATLGLNLIEYRQIRAELAACGADVGTAECVTERNAFAFLRSGALGGTIGLKFPKIHFAIRAIFDYERYLRFRYERPLEVRGPATYNAEKDVFEHPRLYMRSASLWTYNSQLAAAFVF